MFERIKVLGACLDSQKQANPSTLEKVATAVLPNKWMDDNGPRVVEVAYDGPPGLIGQLHDRYAPVPRVGPIEVFGDPVVSQVLHSVHPIGCQNLPACADQKARRAPFSTDIKDNRV